MEELQAELTRLEAVLATIVSGDAAAEAIKPVASDKGGRMLSLFLELRKERKGALQKEIDRLKQRLAEEATRKDGSAQQEPSAEEKMIQWIRDNGGQVSGCLQDCERLLLCDI